MISLSICDATLLDWLAPERRNGEQPFDQANTRRSEGRKHEIVAPLLCPKDYLLPLTLPGHYSLAVSDPGPETKPSDQPESARSHLSLRSALLWLAFLLFVVYPLSVGPAAWVWQQFPAARRPIEALYAPLEQTAKRFPVLARFFEWYIFDVWHARNK